MPTRPTWTSRMALEAFKNVTAPFDGRVTARLIDIGTLVSAGSGSAWHYRVEHRQTNPRTSSSTSRRAMRQRFTKASRPSSSSTSIRIRNFEANLPAPPPLSIPPRARSIPNCKSPMTTARSTRQ